MLKLLLIPMVVVMKCVLHIHFTKVVYKDTLDLFFLLEKGQIIKKTGPLRYWSLQTDPLPDSFEEMQTDSETYGGFGKGL